MTVEAWHLDVEQYDVRPGLDAAFDRDDPVFGLDDDVSLFFEMCSHHGPDDK